MVLNWIWNWKYSKEHICAIVTIQKYTRGYITRKRVQKIMEDLETKQLMMLVWHEITQRTKRITAMGENTQMDFDATIDTIPEYMNVMRAYHKERSRLVAKIVGLDIHVKQMDNDGEPLPRRMFHNRSLFIQGKQIKCTY
jgi:hypothetical protein